MKQSSKGKPTEKPIEFETKDERGSIESNFLLLFIRRKLLEWKRPDHVLTYVSQRYF